MPPPDPSAEPATEPIPEGLAEAGVYRTSAESFDHGLVVLAMGLPCWLMPSGDSFRLLVEPRHLAEVADQLARFERESVGWPPRPVDEYLFGRKMEFSTPLLWALVVLIVFRAQSLWPVWTEIGALDTQAVFTRGELWRVVTALFLHGDAGHLLSNVCCGVFVFSAVLSTLSRRRGWWLLLLAAAAGNFAAAALNFPGPYRSVGASTAIFAGIGLLTGRAIHVARRSRHPYHWRAMFVPLAAGCTVLALYGAGGINIDVGAHLTGFSAGLILGFWFALPTVVTGQPKA